MQKLVVANWKMQKAHNESIAWCKEYKEELQNFCNNFNVNLVLCPEFTAIAQIGETIKDTKIKLGAQDCAFKDFGAYTGDVSAISLKQLDCSYCIIGHSERRLYHQETNQSVAQKAEILIKQNIKPIICVGETAQEHIDCRTLQIIKEQLAPIFEKIKEIASQTEVWIAYEPVWSIGTGVIPTIDELSLIYTDILNYSKTEYPSINLRFIYGGSVTETTIASLNTIENIHGFLLGRASLDFQMLKKIVELL